MAVLCIIGTQHCFLPCLLPTDAIIELYYLDIFSCIAYDSIKWTVGPYRLTYSHAPTSLLKPSYTRVWPPTNDNNLQVGPEYRYGGKQTGKNEAKNEGVVGVAVGVLGPSRRAAAWRQSR